MRVAGVGAQVEVETKLTLRRGESLIVTLGIPVGILVFFGNVDLVDTGYKDPLDFLVPGVLALAVMSTAMVSLGIATGFERRYGVLKRLGTTPLGRSGLLTAKTLTVVTVEVLQAVIIVIAGLILGWSPAVAPVIASVGLLRRLLANGLKTRRLLLDDTDVPIPFHPRLRHFRHHVDGRRIALHGKLLLADADRTGLEIFLHHLPRGRQIRRFIREVQK